MRTVTLDGRRFPIVGVVCPPDPDGRERSEWDRSLGTTGDPDYIIPAENGLLFSLSRNRATWELWVHSPVCRVAGEGETDGPIYLPRHVGIRDGALVVEDDGPPRLSPRATWFWIDAEEDWLVEHIDRLSRLPVPDAPGPRVRLVDPDSLQREDAR